MKINIRKKVYEVTNKDVIVDNGCGYYLIETITKRCGNCDICLELPKRTFEKLLKEKLICFIGEEEIKIGWITLYERRYRFNVDNKGE